MRFGEIEKDTGRGGVDHDLLRSSSIFMASRLVFHLTLFLFFLVNALGLYRGAHTHMSYLGIAGDRKG